LAFYGRAAAAADDDDDNVDDGECRAEKTEVLSEEHQELERRVDLIHRVSQMMLKKLQACLSSQGVPTDAERRMVSSLTYLITLFSSLQYC